MKIIAYFLASILGVFANAATTSTTANSAAYIYYATEYNGIQSELVNLRTWYLGNLTAGNITSIHLSIQISALSNNATNFSSSLQALNSSGNTSQFLTGEFATLTAAAANLTQDFSDYVSVSQGTCGSMLNAARATCLSTNWVLISQPLTITTSTSTQGSGSSKTPIGKKHHGWVHKKIHSKEDKDLKEEKKLEKKEEKKDEKEEKKGK